MRIGENARIFFSEREKSVPAMRVTTLVNKLIGLQGLWVRGFHFQADKARVVVDVVPRRRKPLCGICGRKVRKNKDRYNRYWRHLDLFGVRTYLRYSIRRVVCRRCGVVREKVPWADKGSRFTKSFEQEVAWLAQRTDVSAVANYFRVTWRSVRRIIQRVVAEQRDERRELDGLRVIGMDEISYRKRHKYLTVVIDHLSGRVVWAGKERKAKTLLRFFRKLGPQRAAELEAVSMDMWEPYITVVGKKAPQARVIFDRFHIVKHLNEAVDKTRRELVRELKGTARRNLKNTKFPLLKAKHNRSAKDKRVLREQVRANRRLYRAMLLRDDFMDLYTYKTETWAKKFLRGWLRRAMSSRIEPVKRAAKMIDPQPLRWRHRVGHVETQQRPTRRNEQQNPAAEPPQLWTPLCRSSHQSRLPKLWRSHPREDPLKWQERRFLIEQTLEFLAIVVGQLASDADDMKDFDHPLLRLAHREHAVALGRLQE